MPYPGDIVPSAVVTGVDSNGNHYLDNGGRLPKRYSGGSYSQNAILKNLVALGNNEFALCNYEDALAAYFSMPADSSRRGIWLQRWKKVAGNPGAVGFPNSRFRRNAPPSKQWQMLRTDSWVMPVTEYIYFNCHGQDKKFLPTPLDKLEVSPCYRSDGYPNPKRPPLCYTGRLKFNTDLSKFALIYLHGFANPLKWHYDVWKHELNLIRINPFDFCNEPDKENCRPCSLNIYEKVHNSIKIELQKYWEDILSLWEKSSLSIKKKVVLVYINGYFEVKIGITNPIASVGKKITHQKLIIKGWIYNDMKNGHLILHCNPVSFHISMNDNINTHEYGTAKLIWGELQDVEPKY